MKKETHAFNEHEVLHKLRHFLPTQAPLKDFIHHNTLHAFQELDFHKALQTAAEVFGYKTYLSLNEFRLLYREGTITNEALDVALENRFRGNDSEKWRKALLHDALEESIQPRIGQFRELWLKNYRFNPAKAVHPTLFRLICTFLDQGIATRPFPVAHKGFLNSIRHMSMESHYSLFRTERARQFLADKHVKIDTLLGILVGDETFYETYLFDQQFAHPGWSGMVSVLEEYPQSLLDERKVTLRDFIILELLMEIDVLDQQFGENWKPLALIDDHKPAPISMAVDRNPLFEVYAVWQEAFEWSYYDKVLSALKHSSQETIPTHNGFDALLCIDDRECSFRRHIESLSPESRTFGTAGHFNVDCYFQPEEGKFVTKICPAPLKPSHLIRETESGKKNDRDSHYTSKSHSLLMGWMIAQTIGFWSAMKLFLNIFKPTVGPATSYSFGHVQKQANLSIEHTNETFQGLQVGYTLDEMADRVAGVIRSIGLINGIKEIVYVIGHGASSINNTHYAGYDCGACSGRPGSVNARAFCHMANHSVVRKLLEKQGILIPENVTFIPALHDTTRDEIEFYDTGNLKETVLELHEKNVQVFLQALQNNAVERSGKFELLNSNNKPSKIHKLVKLRSVSLFEPRPELNHATNALCIVGPREFTAGIFMDRRAFLNSYDCQADQDGSILSAILGAVAPVCGGINLEYFFSRTDNFRLGAGSKLPHNVMGLIGVANGSDGDLLPGLPLQMIEIHHPVRLLMVIIQKPEIVMKALKSYSGTDAWFNNEWISLVSMDPDTREEFIYDRGVFEPYVPYSVVASVPKSAGGSVKPSGNSEVTLIEVAV